MTEMLAMEVQAPGGPGALTPVRRALPRPGPGEVLLEQQAIGVNFVDLNHRSGKPYPISAPFVPGIEATGEIIAVGEGVDSAAIGRRMAYAGAMPGAYASHAIIDVDLLFPVPDAIAPDLAAAVTMQAMTASYLAHDAYRVKAGDVVMIHAAAGGVGSYLVQFAKAAGATVVGTSRDANKAQAILDNGADHAVVLETPGDLARVAQVAGPLNAVFDGLGGVYFLPGLKLLGPRGAYVGFGLAAGLPPEINPAHLMGHFGGGLSSSLSVSWVSMGDHVATKEDRCRVSGAVYDAVLQGTLKPRSFQVLPLSEAAEAHRIFESGAFTGKLVLTTHGRDRNGMNGTGTACLET